MLLCRIHNLITDHRYEFQARDQAEIDARLERKVAVYGRPARTETVPAWTEHVQDAAFLDAYRAWKDNAEAGEEPVPDVVEHPETSVAHPAEHVIEIVDLAPQELALARKAAIDAVQARLDLLAQSWGYDHILSLCSYATSKVPRFAAEAQIGVDWRDATWAAVMQYETTVDTLAELIDLLPPVPTRPEIP